MDRYSDMAILVAVVDAGGFSPAARLLNMTHSALSKRVQRLEERLGVQLLLRTTRLMRLTEAGERYVSEARPILDDIRSMESAVVSDSNVPRGRLTLSASNVFGQYHVVPALIEFMRRYPDIKVDLNITDRFVDVKHEKVDLAIRVGQTTESGVVAHKLGESERAICASVDYLERNGTPLIPADLAGHNCLRLNFETGFNDWGLCGVMPGDVRLSGRFTCNSVEALHTLCAAGEGIARLPMFMIGEEVKRGTLKLLFQDALGPAISTIYAVRASGDFVPGKIKLLIDFLIERFEVKAA